MIYRNKKILIVSLGIVMVAFVYFVYNMKEVEWKIYGSIACIWSLILYIFTVFEYYKVDDTKIIHTYRLGFKKDEIYWKDVSRVYIFQDKPLFKLQTVIIGCDKFGDNDMLIQAGIKGYRELIKTVLNKTKDNSDISIDIRLDEFLDN